MPLPRLAPRLAISLILSGLFLAARGAGQQVAAASLAAALIAAMLAPAAGAWGIGSMALLAGLGAALWSTGPGGADAVLAALPLAGNLALAWHFGRTLLPRQEPLIARYTRADFGRMPPELIAYTRALTAVWAAFFVAFAAANAATLAGAGPDMARSAVLNLALSLVFFLGEHPLRAMLFGRLGPVGPLRTLRAMWRAEVAGHAG
jgi:uncharacterized membrane protein